MELRYDHIGRILANFALAFLDETSNIVTALTATFLIYTRSAGVAYFIAGASTCSLTAKLIKRALRQPRPPPILTMRKTKVSYGMPSTHSAAIAFFATYILLAAQYLPIHKTLPQNDVVTRLLPSLISTPWCLAIVLSRVWLGYHTWAQVAAGTAYGVLLTILWFVLWTKFGLNQVGSFCEELMWKWFGW